MVSTQDAELGLAPKYDTGALKEEPAERVLWVYSVHYQWSEPDEGPCRYEDCVPGAPTCYQHKDNPPAGRKWATGHSYRWFKEATADVARDEAAYFAALGDRAPKDHADFSATVTLEVRETWALTWFQHEQPDWGDSDVDVLASFRRYVDRIERLNRHHRYEVSGVECDAICLMGAEDDWRWHGAEPDGKQSDRSDPPCRCRFCKQFNVVRIGH